MQVAPAAFAYPFVAEFMKRGDGFWKCSSCTNNRHHGQFVVLHPPVLQRQILASDALNVQMPSMLDVGLCLTRRMTGFMHGELTQASLVEQPLVDWTAEVPTWSPTGTIMALRASLMRTNPLMQHYLSVMECEQIFS